MQLFEAVVKALIFICLVVLAYYLIFWVLGTIGLAVPIMVQHIVLVIIILIAVLILARLFWPFLSQPWFPPRPPQK